jgi:hypothetical protein
METTKGPFAATTTPQMGVLDARHPSVRSAHLMYGRLLTGWASDLLSLRKRGLDVPTHRVPDGAAIADSFNLRAA